MGRVRWSCAWVGARVVSLSELPEASLRLQNATILEEFAHVGLVRPRWMVAAEIEVAAQLERCVADSFAAAHNNATAAATNTSDGPTKHIRVETIGFQHIQSLF